MGVADAPQQAQRLVGSPGGVIQLGRPVVVLSQAVGNLTGEWRVAELERLVERPTECSKTGWSPNPDLGGAKQSACLGHELRAAKALAHLKRAPGLIGALV